MNTRIVVIWFPHLLTDWMLRRQPALKDVAFALALNERGRKVIKAVNDIAQSKGVYVGMVAADCRAIVPDLQIFDYDEAQPAKLLNALAEWFIRYTPLVAIDGEQGLILDATGCTHLWDGEENYLKDIRIRLQQFGYTIRLAMSDTIGTAWALCHFGESGSIINSGEERDALLFLPAAALRLEPSVLERLDKLGLKKIGSFITMPRTALRRRFGQNILTRISQALGEEMEMLDPITPLTPFIERLPCLELIRTATGIEIGLKILLETLCLRLIKENSGLRKCELRCYRIDGVVSKIEIGTNKPTRNVVHLFKLFEHKIATIHPGMGIELFVLEAPVVEELQASQDALWSVSKFNEAAIAELLDRVAGKIGPQAIHRYLPAEHYWPERSIKESTSLSEKPTTAWRSDLTRPLHLLSSPLPIDVTVPIPDYPPMLFIYRGTIHNVKKADGPERIEQEWWIEAGLYRDYYAVEDEHGARYWLFRSGDYTAGNAKWFIHGFFA